VQPSPPTWTLRVLAAVLAVLVFVPGHRLLDPATAGLAGSSFIQSGPRYGFIMLFGTGVALVVGTLLHLVLGPKRGLAWLRSLGGLLDRPGSAVFALLMGLLAGGLTLAFSLGALNGAPALLDSASQLLHARYLAEGALAGPALPALEFWDFQYMLETPEGWVSQYPPGHILLLSLGFRLGAPWLVGPLLLGATVAVSCLLAEEIFEERVTARFGGLLVATSPFLIGLAGSYMNHVTAALGGTLALYAALRTLRGHWGWSVVVGSAIGLTVVTRPLFGLMMAALATAGTPLLARAPDRMRSPAARIAGVLAGGVPWAWFLFSYNARFFGSPFRFGYTAAQGEAHGLGFHVDPWGAMYGPTEALAYTMGELRALSVELLQSPMPALFVVVAYGLVVARIPRRAWLLVAWAGGLVLANFFYWHHDLVMGPRMLNEAAPAWLLLTAFSGVGLVRWTLRGEGGGEEEQRGRRSRGWLAATLAAALVMGWGLLAPTRLIGYGAEARVGGWTQDYPGTPSPSLVFLHGSWQGRLGSRLVALGLSSDSVRTALAENPLCTIQNALDAGTVRSGALDFARGGRRAGGSSTTAECLRQESSDRSGIFGLPQAIWRGDLPGLPAEGAMYVRDMGPDLNRHLLSAFPERLPLVLGLSEGGAELVLRPYDEGMRYIWGMDEGVGPEVGTPGEQGEGGE